MNSSLALSMFTVLYGHHLCLVPTHLSPQSRPHTPGHHSPLPPPAPGNTSELPVSVGLPVLGGSCKWNQTTCGHWVWLLSFSPVPSGFIRAVTSVGRQPFPWLGCVPCTDATFPLSPPPSVLLGPFPPLGYFSNAAATFVRKYLFCQ